MEAAGLAFAVVSLGLDIATRLQTYIDGVSTAGDRISDLTANVSATASVMRQLATLVKLDSSARHRLDATVTVTDTDSGDDATNSARILFTPEGISQIEALVRRCDRIYKAIIAILASATTDVFLGKLLANVGIADLTARRLARLTSRARWPWLEPRVQACIKQLEAVKVDLLLNLQIASLAQCRINPGESYSPGDDLAMADVARRLMEKRKARSASSVTTASSLTLLGDDSNPGSPRIATRSKLPVMQSRSPATTVGAPQSSTTAASQSDQTSRERQSPVTLEDIVKGFSAGPGSGGQRQNPIINMMGSENSRQPPPLPTPKRIPHLARTPPPETTSMMDPRTPDKSRSPAAPVSSPAHRVSHSYGTAEGDQQRDESDHIEGMPIGPADSDDEVEAWFLLRDGTSGELAKIPVKGAVVRDMLVIEKEGTSALTVLDDYLTLATDQRTAVLEIMDSMRMRDARLRTLVSLRRTDLPGNAELIVMVATNAREENVEIRDETGQIWQVPFYALKRAIASGTAWAVENELRSRCDSHALHGRRLGIFQGSAPESGHGGAPRISLGSLRDVLRPGMNLRIVSEASHHFARPSINVYGGSDSITASSLSDEGYILGFGVSGNSDQTRRRPPTVMQSRGESSLTSLHRTKKKTRKDGEQQIAAAEWGIGEDWIRANEEGKNKTEGTPNPDAVEYIHSVEEERRGLEEYKSRKLQEKTEAEEPLQGRRVEGQSGVNITIPVRPPARKAQKRVAGLARQAAPGPDDDSTEDEPVPRRQAGKRRGRRPPSPSANQHRYQGAFTPSRPVPALPVKGLLASLESSQDPATYGAIEKIDFYKESPDTRGEDSEAPDNSTPAMGPNKGLGNSEGKDDKRYSVKDPTDSTVSTDTLHPTPSSMPRETVTDAASSGIDGDILAELFGDDTLVLPEVDEGALSVEDLLGRWTVAERGQRE